MAIVGNRWQIAVTTDRACGVLGGIKEDHYGVDMPTYAQAARTTIDMSQIGLSAQEPWVLLSGLSSSEHSKLITATGPLCLPVRQCAYYVELHKLHKLHINRSSLIPAISPDHRRRGWSQAAPRTAPNCTALYRLCVAANAKPNRG